MPGTDRRKAWIIDREIQLSLAWRQLIAFVLLLSIGVGLMFAPSVIALAATNGLSALPAATEFLILTKRVWPAIAFITVGLFLYTLIVSHRIAGPVYRINAALRQMIAGEDPDEVKIRKSDFLHETVQLLDELARQQKTFVVTTEESATATVLLSELEEKHREGSDTALSDPPH